MQDYCYQHSWTACYYKDVRAVLIYICGRHALCFLAWAVLPLLKLWRKDMYDRLTSKDIEKMEQEIEHRKLVVRKQAIEDVKEARAHGDLSENFEYKAAKKFKNENESRIRYLEKMVKTAKIIEDDSKDNEAGLNDTVLLYIEDDDCEEEYKIVTTVRCDVMKNMISIESPMGKALLKHKAGDRVYIAIDDKNGYFAQIREIRKSNDETEEINRF